DLRFFRARVRGRWLPWLREENPRVEEALVRLAAAAREQREVLELAGEYLLREASVSPAEEGSGAPAALRISALASAPAAAAGYALALAAARAGGGPLLARHRRALLDLVHRLPSGTVRVDLPGLRAVREYDVLRFEPPVAEDPGEVAPA